MTSSTTLPMSSVIDHPISCGQLSTMISTWINEVASAAKITAPFEPLLSLLSSAEVMVISKLVSASNVAVPRSTLSIS